jgi:hypothetical protein
MRLKVVIVDFEVSRRTRRIAIGVGLPLLALVVATVANASVPVVFQPGATLHAADLNQDFTALDQRCSVLDARITALENAVATPHYAAAVVESDGTLFVANGNVSQELSVTHTGPGTYSVTWAPSDFPNGAIPLLSPAYSGTWGVTETAITESGGGANGIWLQTYNSTGAIVDGWFSVVVMGR